MPELTPELAPQVIAACNANAEEAAGAFGRAFGGEFVLKAGDAAGSEGPIAEGGGLALAFKFGSESLLAVIPAGDGWVPEWSKNPDTNEESRLSTLAQELSLLLVPETLQAEVYEVAWVDDLAAAIGRAAPADDATVVPIEVAAGESLGVMRMVWPVGDATAAVVRSRTETQAETPPKADASAPKRSTVLRGVTPRDFRDLPPNTISALQVAAVVSVNLASKKIPLGEVIELGPGSILTFDKSCDDSLEIAVGDRPIAKGQAVKIGERFGVRVQEMVLPEERFHPMLPPKDR